MCAYVCAKFLTQFLESLLRKFLNSLLWQESSDDEDGKEPGEPERQEKEKRAKVGFVEDAAPAVIHDVTEQDGEGSQGLAAMRDMDPQVAVL